jgi:hypothetical protein
MTKVSSSAELKELWVLTPQMAITSDIMLGQITQKVAWMFYCSFIFKVFCF